VIDLRVGRWQEALADIGEVGTIIADPPYGDRTHTGNAGLADKFGNPGYVKSDGTSRPGNTARSDLAGYTHWTPDDAATFIAAWSGRCRGWFCIMTSDDLITPIRDAYSDNGRLDFAPVPILQHRPRLTGDGPGSGAVYLMVARPRRKEFLSWGSLPCWYMSQPDRTGIVNGAKPLSLMLEIVRDYSRPGDTVCDPTSGGATTLIAAHTLGRRAIGAEMDPATAAKAQARIDRHLRQGTLFEPAAMAVQAKFEV